jgi:RNA polymerase sporulation-specific sigma factor
VRGTSENRQRPAVRSRRMPAHSRGRPRPTSIWERRLIRAARNGDPVALTRLLSLYEPMVRRIARTLYLPGGDRDDLAQEARLGVIDAARSWDPARGVPFSSFAWLCAIREARMAVGAARARKHQILNSAFQLDRGPVDDAAVVGLPSGAWLPALSFTIAGRRDDEPEAKTLAREQLRSVVARTHTLTALERRAIGLAASDYTHGEIADELHVGVRAVNNALQRARHKLAAAA